MGINEGFRMDLDSLLSLTHKGTIPNHTHSNILPLPFLTNWVEVLSSSLVFFVLVHSYFNLCTSRFQFI